MKPALPDSVFDGFALTGRDYASALLFKTGFILSLFLAVLSVMISLSFFLDMPITAVHFPLAAVATIGTAYVVGMRNNIATSHTTLSVLIAVLITGSAMVIAGVFYDLSWDGQAIHQEAVLQLAGGWNPVYSRLDDSVEHAIWIMHYPKGSWLQAAAIYALTGSIETGKAASIILIAASGLFVAALLLQVRNLPVWAVATLAALVALNPVSLYQGLTYYLDGQLSSLYIALFTLLVATLYRPDKYMLFTGSALVVLLINTKFTGLVYAITLLAVFGGALLFLQGWKRTLRLSALPVSGVLVGLLLVGYPTYVHNVIAHGTPFYPLLGEDAIDIVSHAKPDVMKSMNRAEALFTSVFSVSSNSKEVVTPKNPLKLPSKGEIFTFSGNEMRVGGWGPWFGAMLVLALPLAAVFFIACRSRHSKIVLLFSLVAIGVTVLINPESWWARYAPQLILLPLVICIAYLACFSGYMKWPGLLLVAVATLNCAMVAVPQAIANLRGTIKLHRQLSELAQSPAPLTVSFSIFEADRIRLIEAGIPYTSVASEEALPCESPETLVNSFAKVKFCTNTP